jgi:DedD protein
MGSLAVLAAAAFAVGAGAGLLWKAPGLVMSQWGGDTQEVAWADVPIEPLAELASTGSAPLPEVEVPSRDASAPAPARPVAAPYQTASAEPVRPLAQGEHRSAPKPAEKPAAKPAPAAAVQQARAAEATPPVSAPPPGKVAVQVGAFAERRVADQLIAKLESKGFTAYAAAGDGGAWRVRVGPYRDRGSADKAAARLKRDEKLPTWVLEETGNR